MNLFNLFAKLKLDNSDYNKGIEDSEDKASKFGSKVSVAMKVAAKAFAAVVTGITVVSAAMTKLISSSIDYGKQIEIGAQQTQLSTEAYQKWGLVLQMNGLEADKLRDATKELNNKIAEAKTGSAEALLAFDKLGIKYEDIADLSPEEIFYKVVTSLQAMEKGTDKTAAATKIFGEVATELAPIFNMTTAELENQFDSFEKLGLIMSEDMVNASKQISNEWTVLKTRAKNVAFTFAGEFFPEIMNIINALMDLASGSDDAMDTVADNIIGLVDKIIDATPELLDKTTDLILKLVDGLLIILPKVTPKILNLLERILIKVVQLIPSLTSSLLNIAMSLINSLIQLDWGTLLIDLLNVIFEVALGQLPTFVTEVGQKLIQTLINLFATKEGLTKLATIGVGLAEAIINGLITGFESGLNNVISAANLLIKGLSKLWEWTGIPAIPSIPEIKIPRVDFYAEGGMFDKGTMYAVAGEAGAEIVAQGPKGTGVANVRQIADAQLTALRDYGFKEIINSAVVAIVNGITMAMRSNGETRQGVAVYIGNNAIKDFAYKAVDDRLQEKGFKSLRQIGAR